MYFLRFDSIPSVVKIGIYLAAAMLLAICVLEAYSSFNHLRVAFWFGRNLSEVNSHMLKLFWIFVFGFAIVFAARWAIKFIDGEGREL